MSESDRFCHELRTRLDAREVQRATWIPVRENSGVALLITFNNPTCPSAITIPGESGETRVYENTSRPSFCKKCLDYFHREKYCKTATRCGKCSSTEHSEENCPSLITTCMHCEGNHRTGDRSCKRWKQECEIAAIKYRNKTSWIEAKQQYFRNFPDEQTAYIEMMKKPRVNQQTTSTEGAVSNERQVRTNRANTDAFPCVEHPPKTRDGAPAETNNSDPPSNPSVRRREEVSSDDDNDAQEITKKRGRLSGELNVSTETMDEDGSSENNDKIRREVYKMYEEFEQSTPT